jgi:RND family efflux transporter MFP subunit
MPSLKKITVIGIIAALIIFIIIRLFWTRSKNMEHNEEIYNIDEISVTVADVILKDASFTLHFTGTLYPFKELDIPAETQGKIVSLNFELGQYIGKGKVIASIDNILKKINYQSAQTEVNKLKIDYDRTYTLYKNGIRSEQELENSRLAYESAFYRLKDARKQLSLTRITSSISGIISKKYIELGSYVSNGTMIAKVVDISKLKVQLHVSEKDVYHLKIRDRAKIIADVYPDKQFTGWITFISPKADDSHNYLVEIVMDNPSSSPLKAGTFVNVSILVLSGRLAMYIPREALQGSIKNAKVYVAVKGKAKLRNIVIGETTDDYLEVISGLTRYDKVIVSGQVNLTDGRAIKIVNQ